MSRPTDQPKFTWWPYRTLALLVPILAAAASYLAFLFSEAPRNSQKELAAYTVFFAIMGAGNAYLFAIAIGDFGRSVWAVPVGAIAGFVAVRIFGYPFANGLYAAMLAMVATYAMVVGAYSFLFGITATILLGLPALGAFAAHQRFDPVWTLFCGYPFICGVIAASMPYERSISGRINAWTTGTLSAIFGQVLAFLISLVVVVIVEFTLNPGGPASQEVQWLVSSIMNAAFFGIANFLCARRLFYSVYRVNDGAGESAVLEDDEPADGSSETETPKTAPNPESV